MTAATVASVASSQVYNGDGLRMSQTANSVTTDYTWDAVGALPVVLDDETYRYVYGLDLIAAIDTSDDETYFSYDGLGSTTDLTDDTGAVVATYQYDVFGAVRASTGSSGNAFQFTGEQFDPESGFYYLRARFMDPESGRFISRDLIDFPQRYAYADNNPVAFTDPLGLSADTPLSFGERTMPMCVSGSEECPGGTGVAGPANFGGLGGGLGRIGGWVKNQVQSIIPPKITRQMVPRGWTQQQIDEAMLTGNQIPAINRANGNPATRYVHPGTGQSVVRDNVTGEIIHVGGPGFRYGTASGDVPLLPPPGSGGGGGSW